jgi:hypothetical protein
MTINPTSGGPMSRPDATRLSGTAASPQPAESGSAASVPAAAQPADEVEVSGAARELLERGGAEAPPANQLPPERLRQIARRIADGHYDRPEVQRHMLERIMDVLQRGDS